LRGLGTLIVAIAFIGMALWVASSERNTDFAEARMAPFADDPQAPEPEARPQADTPIVRSNQS
jgi:cytochrome c oxidase cbb3-type subunit 4